MSTVCQKQKDRKTYRKSARQTDRMTEMAGQLKSLLLFYTPFISLSLPRIKYFQYPVNRTINRGENKMQYGYIRNGETLLAIFSTTQFLFIICLKINLNLQGGPEKMSHSRIKTTLCNTICITQWRLNSYSGGR